MKVIATTRNTQGTGASRRLRRANKLPGIVYGSNRAATPIELEHNDIFHALRKEKFHASVLTMELDGKEELVILRAFQMHPYKPQVMHIDFQRIDANEEITMRVPLHFVGETEAPAVKVDKNFINLVASYVEVTCLPKALPEFITVDLSGLETGNTVFASDLELPEGTKILNSEEVIASVTQIEEEVLASDDDAAEAAPAEAAEAAAE